MREIGGYIELETFRNKMLYEEAVHLNSGRDCFLYLAQIFHIKTLWLPFFLCDTLYNTCIKNGIEVKFYHIDKEFLPIDFFYDKNDYVYIVNFYGQLSKNTIIELKNKYNNMILDNTQAYFMKPIEGINTLYSCRKYFGVPDGGILFTNSNVKINISIEKEISFNRMNFLLGRYEKNASDFYSEYVKNNSYFDNQELKYMSALTYNLLHGIDYEFVEKRRTENYKYLNDQLKSINQLEVKSVKGAFAYPLLLSNGSKIRKLMIKNKIYVPTLWPNVLEECDKNDLEYRYADNILPLPCDQRYDFNDMKYICNILKTILYN